MRGAMRKVVSGATAVGVALGLLGMTPIPSVPHLRVGTVFRVHVVVDTHTTFILHDQGQGRRIKETDHFSETRRFKVLAVHHGAPTKIEVTFLHLDIPGGGHMLAQRMGGRTFVVTRPPGSRALPTVTEYQVKVAAAVARRVRMVALGLISPKALTAAYRRAMRHPRRRVKLPVKRLDRLLGPDPDSQLLSATLKLTRVARGRAYLKGTDRRRGRQGTTVVHGRGVSLSVVDVATHRVLSSKLTQRFRGHGRVASPVGPVRADVLGKAVETDTYDYAPDEKPAHP